MTDKQFWPALLAHWLIQRERDKTFYNDLDESTYICHAAERLARQQDTPADLQFMVAEALKESSLSQDGYGFCTPDECPKDDEDYDLSLVWNRPELRDGTPNDRRLLWLQEQVRDRA